MFTYSISFPDVVIIYEGTGTISSTSVWQTAWFSPYKYNIEDDVIARGGNIVNMVIATEDLAPIGCLSYWLRHSPDMVTTWDYPIGVVHVGASAKTMALQFKAFAKYNRIICLADFVSEPNSTNVYMSISLRSY